MTLIALGQLASVVAPGTRGAVLGLSLVLLDSIGLIHSRRAARRGAPTWHRPDHPARLPDPFRPVPGRLTAHSAGRVATGTPSPAAQVRPLRMASSGNGRLRVTATTTVAVAGRNGLRSPAAARSAPTR